MRWTLALSLKNRDFPIDVMTASTRSPRSTRALRGASISSRRWSERTTGIASLPPAMRVQSTAEANVQGTQAMISKPRRKSASGRNQPTNQPRVGTTL